MGLACCWWVEPGGDFSRALEMTSCGGSAGRGTLADAVKSVKNQTPSLVVPAFAR